MLPFSRPLPNILIFFRWNRSLSFFKKKDFEMLWKTLHLDSRGESSSPGCTAEKAV